MHDYQDPQPPNSYYASAKNEIEKKKILEKGVWQEREKFAKSVASDVMGNPSPWIWRGGMASIAWWMGLLVPKGWLVSCVRAAPTILKTNAKRQDASLRKNAGIADLPVPS